ncbi:hypothetical protein EMPS_03897 [Entomortierella parvispora]|uniref:Hydrophobin n=1 Tax=Entomortierella parvispora TaxID=205924 RepID=A0A9P3H7N4_9FUNG|nr:hypothetical protein EMPS_03897 [Entomortierella parvispora]
MLFKILAIVTVLSLTEASSHNTTLMSGHNATTPGGHKPHELATACKASNLISCSTAIGGACTLQVGVQNTPLCGAGAVAFCSTLLCFVKPSVMTAIAIYHSWRLPCDTGTTDPEAVYGPNSPEANAYNYGYAYAEEHNPWADYVRPVGISKTRRLRSKTGGRKLGEVDTTQTCCLADNYFGGCCGYAHGLACQM